MEVWRYLLLSAAILLFNENFYSYSSPVNVNRLSGTSVISQPLDHGQDFTVMDWINEANKPYSMEGDIALTERDGNVYEKTRFRRSAVRQRKKLWPNRVVPYEIEEALASHKKNILAAIDEFHKHTCIRFKERKNEKYWIKFSKGKGCWSYIGRLYWRRGAQELSLGRRCNKKGIIMHELMHAVGFWHEQSRPDRDQYVEILWENIEKGMEGQFNKYKHSKVDSIGFDYDYSSLMHYGKVTFSRNGKPTIRALNNPYMSLGRGGGFSELDIKKMNALYDCKNEQELGWSEWSAYTPCNSRCMKYRQRVCFSPRSHCPGADSHGIQTDRRKCSHDECYAPVDGNWGRWAAWDACDKSCGYGKQKRRRTCSDPAPKFGGKTCPGADTQFRMCNMMACLDRYYLYIESSYPARFGYKSQLMSELFEPTEERCLSWWYSMHGRTVGTLNVYHINSRSGNKTRIWSKSGEQGKDWKQTHISFSSDSKYRVLFEGLRGRGYTGDIALDDIQFREGSCLNNGFIKF
ncbi:meprin A subunit beta-like isoform X2 [Porites lutea]|uniref:meprin A subunit beta-like isoform X2 n=1 Tax=Porites lutea TaxID=51062 RepID=UPI003CC5B1C2